MCNLCLTGDWSNAGHVLMLLHQHGYSFMWVHCTNYTTHHNLVGHRLSLVAITDKVEVRPLITLQEQWKLPWIVWMRRDCPHLAAQLYQAGALAVLPPESSAKTLLQVVGNAWTTLDYNQQEPVLRMQIRERHYRSGEMIVVEAYDIVDVLQGIITINAIYPDGTEVLLGFYGAGHILVRPSDESCCMMFRAHTDTSVRSYPWREFVKDPVVSERLRSYAEQTATWSALRSHPYIEQRVVGILRFLAEQFGKPHAYGILIDIRLTHTQLAAASSVTRGTITRIMKKLRQRQQVISVMHEHEERFCLCLCEETTPLLKQRQAS